MKRIEAIMDTLVYICIGCPIGFLLADLTYNGKLNGKNIFLLIMLTIGALACISKSIFENAKYK